MKNTVIKVDMEQYALAYARQGYHVFPACTGRKIPAMKNGFLDATTDLEEIKLWWSKYRYDNIGINCIESGIVVIDCDVELARNLDGIASLRELEATLGKLPKTVTVQTPRGGMHLWFVVPEGISFNGKIGQDIDIKHNGCVLVPPSAVRNWYFFKEGLSPFEIEPAVLPENWLNFLKKEDYTPKQHTVSEKKYNNTNLNLQKIIENCAFVKHCIENAEIVSYAEWLGLGSLLAQMPNGKKFFHKFSKPYPRYNAKQTDRLFDSCLKFGKPQTCRYISSISNACDACERKRRLNDSDQDSSATGARG